MKSILNLAVLAGLAIVLTACNTVNGVRRTVIVTQLPSADAVDASLRDVPRITDVSLTRGGSAGARVDQFNYTAGDLFGTITMEEKGKGTNIMTLYGYSKHPSTQQVLDDTRSLLDIVYGSLRRHSPGLPPATELKEDLIRPPD